MTSLLVADAVLAVGVLAGLVAWRVARRAKTAASPAAPRPRCRPSVQVRSDAGMVVSHKTFDGEVLEFPIPPGEDFVSIADTIAAIDRIAEIADVVRWPPRPIERAA